MSVDDFYREHIFGCHGVRIVHMSGLSAALSPSPSEFCFELLKVAKKHETKISFNLNHRAFLLGRQRSRTKECIHRDSSAARFLSAQW